MLTYFCCSCYDEGKRVAETICFEYNREHNVEIRVARIFNTYGPRMLENDGRVVSNFIVQALQGTPLTVYGDGSQTRSFCYVDDLVEGLVRLMEGDVTGPVNLGNPGEFTISELATIVQKKVGLLHLHITRVQHRHTHTHIDYHLQCSLTFVWCR